MNKHLVGVISNITVGGAEKNFVTLFNDLSERGYRCSIICLNAPGTQTLKISSKIDITSLNFNSKLHILRLIKDLSNYLKKLKPDCVISFMDQTNILSLMALKSNQKIPIIVCERNNPERNLILARKLPSLLQIAARGLRNKVYQNASIICSQTQGASDYFKANCPSVKRAVIANYVETPNTRLSNQEKRRQLIISVARLVPEKGLSELIHTFAKLQKLHPGWTLEIYGEGPEGNSLNKLILKLGIEDAAILKGKALDLTTVYETASIFVLNSSYEGFPNSLLEAMSFGCAAIAKNCHFGPNEMIKDGINGYLSENSTNKNLHSLLEKLILDPQLRELIGENAKSVAQTYTKERFSDEFEALVSSLIKA